MELSEPHNGWSLAYRKWGTERPPCLGAPESHSVSDSVALGTCTMWCNNHLDTVQNTSSLQSKTSYPLNSFSQLLSPPPYPLATTNLHSLSRDLCIPNLSLVSNSAISWTAACQAPLSSTVSQSCSNSCSLSLVMLCNHLILCHLFSFAFSLYQHEGFFQ